MSQNPLMPDVVDGRPGRSRAPKRVPSVTLACTLGDPPVITGILETGRRCARNGISTRLCMSDDEALLRGAVLAEEDQVVLDGHGDPDSALLGLFPLGNLLGGGLSFKARVLMLGCCWGNAGRYRNVVEQCIKKPTVFLGCEHEPRKTHGRHHRRADSARTFIPQENGPDQLPPRMPCCGRFLITSRRCSAAPTLRPWQTTTHGAAPTRGTCATLRKSGSRVTTYCTGRSPRRAMSCASRDLPTGAGLNRLLQECADRL